jgi:hypothetical protein
MRIQNRQLFRMPLWLSFVIGGAAVLLFLAVLFLGRKRKPSTYELGQISDQWISQHRAHSRDSER